MRATIITQLSVALLVLTVPTLCFDQQIDWPSAKTIYDFEAMDLTGNAVSFTKYQDHVLVLFNGATRSCPVSSKGFKQLQQLQDRYGESHGLKIIAFVIDGMMKPSGSAVDISEYVHSVNLSYDVYDKIVSDGEDAHPIYKWMKMQLPEQDKITPASKIVIDKSGKVVAKVGPTAPPAELEETIKLYL